MLPEWKIMNISIHLSSKICNALRTYNEQKAFIYYKKSADKGHADRVYNVGCCYKDGIGVEKDEHKAFIYYQKSADMGNALGTYSVGHCYKDGIGVEKDEQKAFIYYQKSADMGNAEGAYSVGGFLSRWNCN